VAVVQIQLAQALDYLNRGQPRQAAALMRQLLELTPDSVQGLQMLALAMAQQGEAGTARQLLDRATRLQPQSSELWINLGNACLECRDHAVADLAFQRARALGSQTVACWLGQGLACLALHRFVEANDWLARAFATEPDADDVRLAYAQSLSELERFDALAQCLDGVNEAGLNAEQQRVLAWLWAQAGREQQALAFYRRLLQQAPGDHESRIRLALLLERLNRLPEAATVIDPIAPEAAASDAGMFALAAARVSRRLGDAGAAIARLMPVLSRELPAAMRAQLQFELAKCHDMLGAVDAAMTELAHAHDAAGAAFLERLPDTRPPAPLGWLQQRMRHPAPVSWQAPVEDAAPVDPVFLVGFPRSGTTLLERMLDAHPQLDVLDERPALEVAIEQLRNDAHWRDSDLDHSLAALRPAQIVQARQCYWSEVRRHVQPRHRLVDKYPLTMTRLPYVARLFPQSDWLLLLRHPCDCVLSCHMQAFGMNGGALAFASLESTARTYAAVMAWWEEQRQRVPVRLHVLRYEDLVQEVPAWLEALMGFLSLSMAPEQLASHLASATRTRRINTPSYAQVIQPVNANAIDRWKRYRAHFSDATLATLAPWVERYGYRWD
jgi:Flp pilus assembly protein TadD